MRRFTDILGRLFYPEDVNSGEEGNAAGPSGPLDDYNQISIPEERLRYLGRGLVLRFLVEFLPFLLVIFIGIREVISSPSLLNETILLIILPLTVCYLVLVRFDSGSWGLVHPVLARLPQAYRHFRKERLVFQLILGLDLLLAATIAFFILSGSVFLKNGIDFLLLLVGIGLFVNIAIILIYAIEPSVGEYF